MDLRLALARLALAALVAAAPVQAGVFSVWPQAVVGEPGGTTAPALLLAFSGDGATTGVQVDYRFNAAVFTASPVGLGNNGICVLVEPTTVRMLALTFDGTPLPTATVGYCAITFVVAPDAPLGSYGIRAVPGSALCAQGSEPVTPCTALDGPDALVVAPNDALFADGFE